MSRKGNLRRDGFHIRFLVIGSGVYGGRRDETFPLVYSDSFFLPLTPTSPCFGFIEATRIMV
jgi:hypothetical protein